MKHLGFCFELLALVIADGAAARGRHVEIFTPSPACPQGANLGDGCGSQIAGASFQRNPTTFPDYATAYDATITGTGLTRAGNIRAALAGNSVFTGAKQINFNLPGVQYPVGDNPAIEVQAQYYDTGHGGPGFPPGFTYQTTGGGPNGTSPRVYGVYATTPNPTLNNIDFTNGGTDCVTLETSGAGGGGVGPVGVITLNNFRFQDRGACAAAPGSVGAYFIKILGPSTGTTGLVLKNGYFDDNPSDCTSCMIHPISANIFLDAQSNSTLTADYISSINNAGRFFNQGTGASYNISAYVTHSYMEGASMGCLVYGQHGELSDMTSVNGSTGNVDKWSYDTIVLPQTQPYYPPVSLFHGQGCLTAPLYFAGGVTNASWTVDEDHVLSITNLPGSGHSTATAATIEIGYSIYPNPSDVTVTNVWADPNGTTQCAANAGGGDSGLGTTSPVMNIVDLYDGSVTTNFDPGSRCAGHANP